MNETIKLNSRQKEIVNIISMSDGVSRDDITNLLPSIFTASKATLARDLKILIEEKFVEARGSGPSTTYISSSKHPLLSFVDLDQYFSVEPDDRKSANDSFNPDIFDDLRQIISKTEKSDLDSQYRSFHQACNQVDKTILERELERYIIELSWKSSKIEGNTYTLIETESLIKQGIEAQGRSKHETKMILNHKQAFKLILENQSSSKH